MNPGPRGIGMAATAACLLAFAALAGCAARGGSPARTPGPGADSGPAQRAGKPAPSPQAAFLAIIPKPVAPFDTAAWFARHPESYRRLPRHTMPTGGFMIGSEYTSQDSADDSEKRSRNPLPEYLESVSPEAADKIIIYGYARHRRIEIRDTLVHIRYGWGAPKGGPDSAVATLTRQEKESLDSALAGMPGGTFWSRYLLGCDGPGFYLSAYGVKRVFFHPCLRILYFVPENPFAMIGPLLRAACLRQGLPDVTDR